MLPQLIKFNIYLLYYDYDTHDEYQSNEIGKTLANYMNQKDNMQKYANSATTTRRISYQF